MSGNAREDRLVWIDLEMTGLDVRRHVIVEIAVLVTDAALAPLDDGIDLVVHQPPSALAEMDDVVLDVAYSPGHVLPRGAGALSTPRPYVLCVTVPVTC